MATVSDLMSWSADGADCKGYLGISTTSEDDRLSLWFGAAVEEADAFLNRSDLTDPIESVIRLTIYSAVKAAREAFTRQIRIKASHVGAVGMTFGDGGDAALNAIRVVITEGLRPWRNGDVAMI